MSEETSIKNFEWHRERVLREKRNQNAYSNNRVDWNAREVEKKHGSKAVKELAKEFKAKEHDKKRKYYT